MHLTYTFLFIFYISISFFLFSKFSSKEDNKGLDKSLVEDIITGMRDEYNVWLNHLEEFEIFYDKMIPPIVRSFWGSVFFFLFVVLLVVLKCHSLIRTFFLHIFYWTKLSFCLLNEIQLMDFLRGFIQRTYKREHNLPKIYRPRALQHRLTTRGCVIDFRLSYNVLEGSLIFQEVGHIKRKSNTTYL